MSEKLKATITSPEIPLESLPLSLANVIREDPSLTREQKTEAVALVRKWTDYVEKYGVRSDDPYILRSHLESFADSTFGIEKNEFAGEIQRADVNSIVTPSGEAVSEMISGVTRPEILNDPRVIVHGGTARTILKAYANPKTGVDRDYFTAELPINDVDMMIVGDAGAREIAELYGSDLSGTKIVQVSVAAIQHHFETVDVTMNQVVVNDGELIYTKQAVEDISKGLIRAVGSDKPLFDRDSIVLPSGEIYLLRGGFYRTLAMLLRGRGKEVVVSQENINAEKEKIGRYWLVLLFVKLLKMPAGDKQDEAILQWHQVAKDIGSTQTGSPLEFFDELMALYPGFSYGQQDNDFNSEAQTRWLVSKLAHRGEENVLQTKASLASLPQTYTPANIALREYEGDRDLSAFKEKVDAYRVGLAN